MKLRFIITLALAGAAGGLAIAADDSGRRADIVDSKGVSTFVTGLHYCYEEEEGDELFVNKYDDLFVQRGAATIRVRLDSLARVNFTGKVDDNGALRLFEARITTRTGSESVASVICHPGGFITGKVDLGELQLPLEKVKSMVFPAAKETALPKFRCTVCVDTSEAPEGAVNVAVDGKGALHVVARAVRKPLSDPPDLKTSSIVLSVDGGVTYPILRRAFAVLAQAGVTEVYLLP